MYRLIFGFLFISILVSACTPVETPEPIVEYNFSYVYTSEGMTHQAIIADKEVSIRLTNDGGIDTSGVVVAVYDLRSSYLIETAAPRGSFLPAIQFEPGLDLPLPEIFILQTDVDRDPLIHIFGGEIPV